MRLAAILPLVLLAGLAPACAKDADPTRYPPGARAGQPLADIRAAAATFPLYLEDGTTLPSRKEPMLAFGRVRIDPPGAGARWIDDDLADLDRSRVAWEVVNEWAALDQHPWQGRTVPKTTLPAPSGGHVTVPDGKGPVLLWPWRSY